MNLIKIFRSFRNSISSWKSNRRRRVARRRINLKWAIVNDRVKFLVREETDNGVTRPRVYLSIDDVPISEITEDKSVIGAIPEKDALFLLASIRYEYYQSNRHKLLRNG